MARQHLETILKREKYSSKITSDCWATPKYMNNSVGYFITAVSKEDHEHISQPEKQYTRPTPTQEFPFKRKKKKKSIKWLVFCTETNARRKQILNSPTSLFCQGWWIYSGIFQRKLCSSHVDAETLSIWYYPGSCWKLHVLSLGAVTTREWDEI